MTLQKNPQMFSLGLKEVWKVACPEYKPGYVIHTAGFPLGTSFGGGFLYCGANNYASVGLIVGLNYKDPYKNLYEEFQRFKSHPKVRKFLEKGQCVCYGARVLEEGGYHSLFARHSAPGVIMVGSGAGYLNFHKIKGVHTAIRSGKLAAENIFQAMQKNELNKLSAIHNAAVDKSAFVRELRDIRGYPGTFFVHPYLGYAASFLASFKPTRNMINALPFKKSCPCWMNTRPAAYYKKKPVYPSHDNVYSFDIDKSLGLSGVHHEYDQPSHLKIRGEVKDYEQMSVELYDKPEERFCPGKVFEFVNGELKFNAQNCIHCKTCTIKVCFEDGKMRVVAHGEDRVDMPRGQRRSQLVCLDYK